METLKREQATGTQPVNKLCHYTEIYINYDLYKFCWVSSDQTIKRFSVILKLQVKIMGKTQIQVYLCFNNVFGQIQQLIHEWKDKNVSVNMSCQQESAPDRWSEWVSALGLTVSREPSGSGRERERATGPLAFQGPKAREACLVGGCCWQETHVYREKHTIHCLTVDYINWIELTDMLYSVWGNIVYVCCDGSHSGGSSHLVLEHIRCIYLVFNCKCPMF